VDSDHNKALIAKMPDVYRKAGRPNDGKTVFLLPSERVKDSKAIRRLLDDRSPTAKPIRSWPLR